MSADTGFSRAPALDALGIPVAFLVVRGIERTVPAVRVREAADRFVHELLRTTSYESVAAEPALAGYRDLHARAGKTGRQFLPSPESLFKQLFRRGGWRAIDPLVDAYSLVSLRTRVSIGAHDLARVSLPVRLARTDGSEFLVPIGETAPLRITAGEYAYLDAAGQVLGRMEIRQAAATCVTAQTTDVLFIVQGHAGLPAAELTATAAELIDCLTRLVGPCADWRLNVIA